MRTPQQIDAAASAATAATLEAMLADGFYHVYAQGIAGPTTWDINRGWCRRWAEEMRMRLGVGRVVCVSTFGLAVEHYVYAYRRLYYDAQNPEGVPSVRRLHSVLGLSRVGCLSCVWEAAKDYSKTITDTLKGAL